MPECCDSSHRARTQRDDRAARSPAGSAPCRDHASCGAWAGNSVRIRSRRASRNRTELLLRSGRQRRDPEPQVWISHRCTCRAAASTPRRRGRLGVGIWAAKSAVLVAADRGLEHAAARLLLHMAVEVRDQRDPQRDIAPRRFWQGRASLAIGLGFKADDADSAAAHSAVKRALRQLIDAGVVELLVAGRFNRASEYHLRLQSDGKASTELVPPLRLPPKTEPPQGTGERTPGRSPPRSRTRAERLAAARFAPPADAPMADVAIAVGDR